MLNIEPEITVLQTAQSISVRHKNSSNISKNEEKAEKLAIFFKSCLTTFLSVLYYVPVRLSRDEMVSGAEIKIAKKFKFQLDKVK